MIDRRPTMMVLVLATAVASGGWWLQRRMQTFAPMTMPAATSPHIVALQVGDRADDLALPDLDGKTQRLSQWRGQKILLNFWATWCAPCRKELPALSAAQARYAMRGVQVIGIALDQPAAVREYLRQTKVDYPILIGIDADPVPTERLGDTVDALPYSVLIRPDGRILHTKLGGLSADELDDWLGK